MYFTSQRLETYENWSAAQRGTVILRQERFACLVSRIPYTMSYFDVCS